MSYESPIEIITSQLKLKREIFLGKEIVKAVQNVGVNVNKAELLKALAYDREQYQKGYKDRDNEIVRCEHCRYWSDQLEQDKFRKEHHTTMPCIEMATSPEFYCRFGKSKDGGQE